MTAPGDRAAVGGRPGAGRAPAGRVEVRGLAWRPYGRREPVLPGVDLTVPAGQRLLLAGPSGSGKSTLLRALAGLLETVDAGALAGEVTVDGRPPSADPGTVGLVLQEPGAGVVASTVGRDVAFGLENVRIPREAMPELVGAALSDVGLSALPPDTPTRALSGGETQRLAIAGALALTPSVLLLDEPTAMLDPASAARVRDTVAAVAERRGLTTVVVEHLLGPWVEVVDRMVVLDGTGRLVADGTPERVLREHADQLAELGIWTPGAPDPEPLPVPPGLLGPSPGRAAGPQGEVAPAVESDPVVVDREVGVGGVTRVRRTLRGPALACPPGSLTALVGPSGSGKSTELLALAGLVRPTRGSVRLAGGRDPAALGSGALAAELSWVPQWASSTIVARTVREEVLATSRALGRDEEARQRADAVLDALGLAPLAGSDPRDLSGGEQRRLALAAAVVHRPAVLLADEPTVGQDRHTWAAVLGLVEAVRAGGGAVVLATHDPAVTARADRVHRFEATGGQLVDPEPARPLLTRCGPLSLMGSAALAVVASLASPGWAASLAALGVAVVLGGIGLLAPGPGVGPRRRWRRLGLRLAPGLLAVASVAWSTWLLGGRDLVTAGEAGLRILLFVVPAAVVLPYVDPDALGDHLAQRLRLPPRPVVAVSAALQRLDSLGELWHELSRARRVRGLGPGRSVRGSLRHAAALTTGLLLRTLAAAAELAVAMDARGFGTAHRRTWATRAPWRTADTLALAGGVLLVLVTTLARL